MRLNYVNIMKQPVKISICSMVLSVLTLIIIAGVFFLSNLRRSFLVCILALCDVADTVSGCIDLYAGFGFC